ncbi:hypothetical protein JT306_02150 [Salmonella enterica subsp. enterica serovar Kentucky]|nr:hypothetical protein [Salmonella enterica subsp. enterica serovar Kentucky]
MRKARDTVIVPTPASWATSAIVTLPVLRRLRVSTYKFLRHYNMLRCFLLSFFASHDWQYTP